MWTPLRVHRELEAAARVELDGKAHGGVCRHQGRPLEATFPAPAMLPAAGSQERRCALQLSCMASSKRVLLRLQLDTPSRV